MNTITKIFLWIVGGFLAVSAVSAAMNPAPTQLDSAPSISGATLRIQNGTTESATPPSISPSTPPSPTKSIPTPTTTNTYVNVDGNTVQSPTYYDSAQSGASAQCRDGTYSFSQHRSGTCSHHGGVAEWL